MQLKPLLNQFSRFRDASLAIRALVFLHELSAPASIAQPPRDARWQRMLERPPTQWGAALDAGARACVAQWPEQLAGFFDGPRFADESPATIEAAVDAIERLFRSRGQDGPWDRRTILADISQELRGLTAKQAQGAFFTPWTVARFLAQITLTGRDPQDLWILDPAVGGGVLLQAALAVIGEQHGRAASQAVTLIGVDVNPEVCRIARASLLLAGASRDQFWIFCGNSLAQPVVGTDRRDGQLKTIEFHVTLANPPFNAKTTPASLQAHAQHGPLVIPDHILYRQIPRRADQPPAVPTPAAAPEPVGPVADVPEIGAQLRLPFAA